MKQTIGVLGLGNIGGSVARNLLKSDYVVKVYDISLTKVEELVSLGAIGSKSIDELLVDLDYLVTSLPNDEIINDTLLQNVDLFNNLAKQLTLIELSTILPETLKNISRRITNDHIDILDCPISGGPNEAEKGELNLIVSGEDVVFQKSLNVLNKIGSQVHYVGDKLGDAKAIKLINNIMTMGNVLVASEAFALGVKHGIKSDLLYDVLSQTGGTSHHFKKRFPKVVNNDYSPWFSIELGKKDLDLAKQWADKNDYSFAITTLINNYYHQAVDSGMKDEDIVAIIKLFLNEKEKNKM